MVYQEKSVEKNSKPIILFWMVTILWFVWIIFGLLAFAWSIACVGRSETFYHDVIGIILAMTCGPFYWIYFVAVKKYCVIKS